MPKPNIGAIRSAQKQHVDRNQGKLFSSAPREESGLFGDHETPALNGKVTVTEHSIVHDLSHGSGPEKTESVTEIPELLKRAVFVQTETDQKHLGLKPHLLVARLNQAGVDHVISLVVRENNGKLFYDHELLTKKEGVPTEEALPGSNSRSVPSEEKPSWSRVAMLAIAVKNESSLPSQESKKANSQNNLLSSPPDNDVFPGHTIEPMISGPRSAMKERAQQAHDAMLTDSPGRAQIAGEVAAREGVNPQRFIHAGKQPPPSSRPPPGPTPSRNDG